MIDFKANNIEKYSKYIYEKKKNLKEALEELNVLVIRNYTVENMDIFLKYEFLKENIEINLNYSNYDDYMEKLIQLANKNEDRYEYLWVALDYEILLERYNSYENCIEFINKFIDVLLSIKNIKIIFQKFAPTIRFSDLYYKSISFKEEIDFINNLVISKLNSEIDLWIDLLDMQWKFGIERSLDRKWGYIYKNPFSQLFMQEYSKKIASHIMINRGKVKKVIVLDADNTLWGGIIGEDGIENIKLDKKTSPGVYYYNFQKKLKYLLTKGYILALNSKNNYEDIEKVFHNHPNCILKIEDFVSIKANWERKDINIVDIANELNLDVSSFIFIDDSPTECELIRQMIPAVEVIEVKKANQIEGLLYNYEVNNLYLERGKVSKRTEQYIIDKERKKDIDKYFNIEDYIESLGISLSIRKLDIDSIDRAVEMCIKTNQFNFTTKRYGREDFKCFFEQVNYSMYMLSVEDKFGNYGDTGLIMLKKDGNDLIIDSFLMSCRILGKNIEYSFLDKILNYEIKKNRIENIIGLYKATTKNIQLENFYEKLNFKKYNLKDKTLIYKIKSKDLDIPTKYHYKTIKLEV